MVVDGEGAEQGGGLLLALSQVRLLADELFLLDPRPGHARLHRGVLALELGAEGAVALLEPSGGAVDADPGRDEAMRLAGFADEIPEPAALLDGDVELPAEVAHVGDP
jgi:hypothetical protein